MITFTQGLKMNSSYLKFTQPASLASMTLVLIPSIPNAAAWSSLCRYQWQNVDMLIDENFIFCDYFLQIKGNSGEFTKLIKDKLSYLGAVDLTQYYVLSYEIIDEYEFLNKSTHGNKGVQVDFIFSRRLLNQILTVFMPTIAIVIVSFCTSLFKV